MGLVRLLQTAFVLAVLAGAAACASSGAVPRPFPGAPASEGAPEPPAETVPRSPAAKVAAQQVVESALRLRGVPYRNGGSDPKGFDCSGLVQYVFRQHGVTLPREVREQVQLGREVRVAGIEPGDLIFFATSGGAASHVGISIGGDQFVHAPSTRGVVRVERFSDAYWSRRIVKVKRLSQP